MTSRTTRIVIVALLLAASQSLSANEPTVPRVAVTPHFAFYSDFATNLNDALIVAGSNRKREKPELFQSGAGEACFSELAPSARAGWNLAVDFYAEIVSPSGWTGRQQSLIRADLGNLHPLDERAMRFVGIVHGLLSAATPAYEDCRWKTQDEENRRFVESLLPRLDAHAAAIAPRLEKLYATPWHGLPIRVDVVRHAPPVGANTKVLLPEGGHILVSSETDPSDALEIVFHEGSHTLCAPWRPDPVPAALSDAAKELDMETPRDLWHVVLFYTTGKVVENVLEEAGESDYTPYLYKYDHLWGGSWGRFRHAIESTWPAYMNGERTLQEGARNLMRTLEADLESD